MGLLPPQNQGTPSRSFNKPANTCWIKPCCGDESPWAVNVNENSVAYDNDGEKLLCHHYFAAAAAPRQIGYDKSISKYVWRVGKKCTTTRRGLAKPDDYYDVGGGLGGNGIDMGSGMFTPIPYDAICCEWYREFEGQQIDFFANEDDEYVALFIVEADGTEYISKCISLGCPESCDNCAPDCLKVEVSGYTHGRPFWWFSPPGSEAGDGLVTLASMEFEAKTCVGTSDGAFSAPIMVKAMLLALDLSHLNGTYTLPKTARDSTISGGLFLDGLCSWGARWRTYVTYPPSMHPTSSGFKGQVNPSLTLAVENSIGLHSSRIDIEPDPNHHRWLANITCDGGAYGFPGCETFLRTPINEGPPPCPEIGPFPQFLSVPIVPITYWRSQDSGCDYGLRHEMLQNQDVYDYLHYGSSAQVYGWNGRAVMQYSNLPATGDDYYDVLQCRDDPNQVKGLYALMSMWFESFYPISCPRLKIVDSVDELGGCPVPSDDPMPEIPDPPEPLNPRCVCLLTGIQYNLTVESANTLEELDEPEDETCPPETVVVSNTDPLTGETTEEEVPSDFAEGCLLGYKFYRVRLEVWSYAKGDCRPVPEVVAITMRPGLQHIATCRERIYTVPSNAAGEEESATRTILEGLYVICNRISCPTEDDPIEDTDPVWLVQTDNGCIRAIRMPCEEAPEIPASCCPDPDAAITFDGPYTSFEPPDGETWECAELPECVDITWDPPRVGVKWFYFNISIDTDQDYCDVISNASMTWIVDGAAEAAWCGTGGLHLIKLGPGQYQAWKCGQYSTKVTPEGPCPGCSYDVWLQLAVNTGGVVIELSPGITIDSCSRSETYSIASG